MENYSGIWVFAQQQDGQLNPVSLELLSRAQELKAHSGETVSAVLLGHEVAGLSDTLIAQGADQVILAQHQALATYSPRPYQKVMSQLAEKYKPSIIMYGATSLGRDLAPRIMVSLGTGLTADAIEVGFDEDGVFYQTTPGYGGELLAHIVILERRPQMVTVRPQTYTALAPDYSRSGKLICESVDVCVDPCYEVLGHEEKPRSGASLDEAKLIISGGRGVKKAEELQMLETLAQLLGAQLAGSRPLIDSGLLPHQLQLGQSGSTVKPDMIINVAISGSIQYRVGMQKSKCILSINSSPSAAIFDISNYGAVADFKALLPAVIEEIKRRRS